MQPLARRCPPTTADAQPGHSAVEPQAPRRPPTALAVNSPRGILGGLGSLLILGLLLGLLLARRFVVPRVGFPGRR